MLWIHPNAALPLPWGRVHALRLPDHLHRTYELILALAAAFDGERTPPMLRRELAALRGVGVRALDEHLAALRARGLVRSDPTCNGLCLALYPLHATGMRHLAVPTQDDAVPTQDLAVPAQHLAAPTQDDAVPAQHLAVPTHNLAVPAQHLAVPTQDLTVAAQHLPAPTQHLPPLHREGLAIADSLAIAQAKAPERELARRLLLDAGVYAHVAERLLELPWISADLIAEWVATLQRRKHVRNLGAVLARVLSERPPGLPAPDGAYAPPIQAAAAEAEDAAGAEGAGEEDEESEEDAAPAGTGPPPPRPSPSLPFAWEAFLEGLRARCGAGRVDPWLAAAYPVAYRPGALTLALGSPMAVSWVEASLGGDLHAVASELCGARTVVNAVVARGP